MKPCSQTGVRKTRYFSKPKNSKIQRHKLESIEDRKYKHLIYNDSTFIPFLAKNIVETQILASLTLQKLLYINIYFDILFWYLNFFTYVYKSILTGDSFAIIGIIILFLWALLEWGRIYCGYLGNLKESFPELITFPFINL